MTKSIWAVLVLILIDAAPAQACYTPVLSGINRTAVERTRVVIDPMAAAMVAGGTNSIRNGYEKWNNATCQTNQEDFWVRPFPAFGTLAGSGSIAIRRENLLSSDVLSSGRDTCASIGISRTNVHHNATIRLYTHIKRHDGSIFQCNWDSAERTALLVAHELGHYLGLDESACHGSIMGGWQVSWNTTTGIATYLGAGHAIRDYECRKADELSISPTESSYQDQACSTDPDCDPYAPCWSSPGCTCPILLDLDQDQFQLASRRRPVRFDIDNDGEKELITWTRGGSEDAFLCWDRNGNGTIDNGSELFGNATELANGSIAPFGYLALSELDGLSFGGNLDGLINKEDAVFSMLCLWTDRDHDGQTDPLELQDLASAGVIAIGVNWTTRSETDEAGNLFLYHGQAVIKQGSSRVIIPSTDVFFAEVERPYKPRD